MKAIDFFLGKYTYVDKLIYILKPSVELRLQTLNTVEKYINALWRLLSTGAPTTQRDILESSLGFLCHMLLLFQFLWIQNHLGKLIVAVVIYGGWASWVFHILHDVFLQCLNISSMYHFDNQKWYKRLFKEKNTNFALRIYWKNVQTYVYARISIVALLAILPNGFSKGKAK